MTQQHRIHTDPSKIAVETKNRRKRMVLRSFRHVPGEHELCEPCFPGT